MATFPVLYKLTSTGAPQFWEIKTEGADIITVWGRLDGAKQTTSDTIHEGKNIGKSNETTAEQQADLEAKSQWEKKLKKGYVQSLNDAKEGKRDKIIEGGVDCMLAHRYDQHAAKIKWPAISQPKLDGHRCLALIDGNNNVTLWSRTRKPITGVPHLIKQIASLNLRNQVLDGELYNHDFKEKFEELTSFIRSEEPKEGHEVVEYHVYDNVDTKHSCAERNLWLQGVLRNPSKTPQVKLVESKLVHDEDDLMLAFETFRKQGYEGLMVRNTEGLYVGKRSYDLLKVKEFEDGEFEVVGVEEGRGKLAGHAIFVCKTKEKDSGFAAKMAGETSKLKYWFENPEKAIGRMLTVQYQGFTTLGKPRFPVALRFREDV